MECKPRGKGAQRRSPFPKTVNILALVQFYMNWGVRTGIVLGFFITEVTVKVVPVRAEIVPSGQESSLWGTLSTASIVSPPISFFTLPPLVIGLLPSTRAARVNDAAPTNWSINSLSVNIY